MTVTTGITGFVGLGNMGRHIAGRLHGGGQTMLVYDRDPEARARAAASGMMVAESVEDLATRSTTVFLSLPTPAVVATVGDTILSAPGGALQAIVDLSTTGTSGAKALGECFVACGIRYLDCPVSGGVGGAEKGTLTLMASGERALFDALQPLLDLIGTSVFYLGPQPGQAQTMKLINNALSASAVVASYEGLVMGAKAGLDPAQMLDIINRSSGRSFATEVKIKECILDRSFPQRFATELVHKDVGLFCSEAQKLGAPMWIIPAVMNVFGFAVQQGMGKLDYGHVIRLYEQWAGAEFGSTEYGKA